MSIIMKKIKKFPMRYLKKSIGYEEIYTLCYRPLKRDKLFETKSIKEEQWVSLRFNNQYWYADPILYNIKGKDFLFMEAYDRKKEKGCIACSQLVDDIFTEPQIVIEEKYHMSFPMVFSWNDEIYMIPETSDNMSINIYKYEQNDNWKLIKSFNVEEKYVDTIVVNKNQHQVSFLTSVVNKENPLLYKWQVFNINSNAGFLSIEFPETNVYDKKYSGINRNAGRLFYHNDKLIHVVQESNEYDYGVNLLFYNVCGGQDQELISTVHCNSIDIVGIKKKNYIGIHTYCYNDKYEIIDMRYLKYNPKYIARKILNIIKK